MDRAFGNENDISCSYVMSLIADRDRRFAAQDVLLMFQGVRMARHAATLLHGKFAQGKIGTFLGGDQDLDRRILPRRHVFRFHIVGMFDWHNYSPSCPCEERSLRRGNLLSNTGDCFVGESTLLAMT